jgi:DNA-directed RNA polymerase specialized sigma24 family protein
MAEVNMRKAKQTPKDKTTQYATEADFCQVFDQHMNSLYLLAFLLTADQEKAERCFVAGLEDSVEGNKVFKEWARSWARRMIIQNAVEMINPQPIRGNSGLHVVSIASNDKTLPTEAVEIAAVLALPSFDRFVFVMSVLERYSDQDCSVLLGCARRDVLAARTRSLQQIGSAAEFPRKLQVDSGSEQPILPDDAQSAILELQAS